MRKFRIFLKLEILKINLTKSSFDPKLIYYIIIHTKMKRKVVKKQDNS